MDEIEARQILSDKRKERDIEDPRTCVQIVSQMKLLQEIVPVIEIDELNKVE